MKQRHTRETNKGMIMLLITLDEEIKINDNHVALKSFNQIKASVHEKVMSSPKPLDHQGPCQRRSWREPSWQAQPGVGHAAHQEAQLG